MRVQIIDPSAYTRPYDHALSEALARAGADVELLTSRFLHGEPPAPAGYRVRELFYRRSARRGLDAPARRFFKLAEHVPDLLRLRACLDADVVHYQWLPLPLLDSVLLPGLRPRVLTAHNTPSETSTRFELGVFRRILGRMDAIVVHSRSGASRLRELVGFPSDRIHVIPHGAFDYLTDLAEEAPLTEELAAVNCPVILFFGLLRPYKGVDLLLRAFERIDQAELWIVGNPRMPLEPLRAAAERARGTVRFVSRFIDDCEIPALFRRADVVVLPYSEVDQSGVLYIGLSFGKAMILSAVGGFPEIALEHGAARLVPPDDPEALAAALRELLRDPETRGALEAAAARAADGPFSWDRIARQTLRLYEELLTSHRHG